MQKNLLPTCVSSVLIEYTTHKNHFDEYRSTRCVFLVCFSCQENETAECNDYFRFKLSP